MALLLALLLCQDPAADIDRLVRDLGHDLIDVRERAHARLLASGTKAIPFLRTAVHSSDAEVRLRVGTLLEVIEREDRERGHDADEFKSLLSQARADVEQKPGHGISRGAGFWMAATSFDGGWVISTWARNDLDRRADEGPGKGQLQFDLRSIVGADGKELVVERCGRCSPAKVYVKQAAGPIKARITGEQVWFSPYPLEFQNPHEGQIKRVGDFTIQVTGLALHVSSKSAFPESWISSLGSGYDGQLKEGIGLHSPVFGRAIG